MHKMIASSNRIPLRFDGTESGLLEACLLQGLPVGSVVQSPMGVFLLTGGSGRPCDHVRLLRLASPCPGAIADG